MSATVLKDEMRAARKLTADQQLLFDAAETDKGRILPGQKYNYRRGVYEGSMFTWRARPGMDSICTDHGLYDD